MRRRSGAIGRAATRLSGEVSRSRLYSSGAVLVACSGAVFLFVLLCSRRPWLSGQTAQRVRGASTVVDSLSAEESAMPWILIMLVFLSVFCG